MKNTLLIAIISLVVVSSAGLALASNTGYVKFTKNPRLNYNVSISAKVNGRSRALQESGDEYLLPSGATSIYAHVRMWTDSGRMGGCSSDWISIKDTDRLVLRVPKSGSKCTFGRI